MTCEGADYSLEPLPSIEGYTYHAHSPLYLTPVEKGLQRK